MQRDGDDMQAEQDYMEFDDILLLLATLISSMCQNQCTNMYL